MATSSTSLLWRSGMLFSTSTPAVCAMASTIRTPGMTGKSGKWPLKKRLVASDVLDADDALGFQLDDAVDQQKWVAMRQNVAGCR